MQIDFDSIICLLCCMNLYSWGIIFSLFRICTHLLLYLYSSKILQQYVAATVWMHSDEALFSTSAPRMKTVIRRLFINHFRFRFGRRLHVNQPLFHCRRTYKFLCLACRLVHCKKVKNSTICKNEKVVES